MNDVERSLEKIFRLSFDLSLKADRVTELFTCFGQFSEAVGDGEAASFLKWIVIFDSDGLLETFPLLSGTSSRSLFPNFPIETLWRETDPHIVCSPAANIFVFPGRLEVGDRVFMVTVHKSYTLAKLFVEDVRLVREGERPINFTFAACRIV